MRKDMSKIIVERARPGSRTHGTNDEKGYSRRAYGRNPDLDDLPRRESMTRRYGQGRKYPNENLNPLRRFLYKNVGRPWDKVYAEICSRINQNSTVQQHILQHVFDFVEKNAVDHDGRAMVLNPYCGWMDVDSGLYIDPRNGLLRKAKDRPGRKRHRRQPNPDILTYNNCPYGHSPCQYRKFDGIWYYVELRKVPEVPLSQIGEFDGKPIQVRTSAGSVMDAVLRASLFSCTRRGWRDYNSLFKAYGRTDLYAHSVKQASKKELKWVGIRNDKEEA